MVSNQTSREYRLLAVLLATKGFADYAITPLTTPNAPGICWRVVVADPRGGRDLLLGGADCTLADVERQIERLATPPRRYPR